MAKPALYGSGAKLYETEATDPASVAQPGLSAGAPGAPAPPVKLVNVVDQDGNAYSLPETEIPRALSMGYQVETADGKAVREYVDENRGLSGDAKVALKSFANEATFGILGAIDDHTGDPLDRAKSEALKKAHKVSNVLGGGAGFAASLLYGGEFFEGANALGKGVEAVALGTRVGEKAAVEGLELALRKAAPELGAAAAKEIAPGLFRKMVASGAKEATVGAALGAPRALTEAAFGDTDAAAETLLYGAGGGALFGLVGPVAGKIKDGLKSGFTGLAAVEKEAAQVGGKSAIGKMADNQAFRSIASNNASLKIAAKDARFVGGAAGVGETLNELGLVRQFREDAVSYAERLAAAKNEWGESIGQMTKKLDTLSPTAVDRRPIFEKIESEVLVPLKQKVGFEPVEKRINGWVSSLSAKTEGGLTFERLHDARRDLDSLIFEAKGTSSPAMDELKKIRRIVETEFEAQGDAAAKAAGKDFLVPWKTAKKNFGRIAAAEKGAKDYAEREMTNRVLSPTDYGTGIGGAMLGGILSGNPLGALGGVVAGAAHNVIRTEGNAVAARALYAMDKGGLLGIEQAMKATAEKLDTIPTILDRLGKGKPSDAALETLPTHALTDLIHSMNVDGGGSKKGDAFRSVSDALTSLATDPEKMAGKLAELTAPFSTDAPKIAAAYSAKLAGTVAYLQQQLPKAPAGQQSPFSPKSEWRPSDQQLSDFSRRVAVALDPFAALKRLENRTIGKPEVQTLKALYPKTYDEIRQRVIEHPRELPYADRLKLGQLLEAPLDRSVKMLSTYQGVFASEDAAQANASKGGSMPAKSRSLRADKLPNGASDFQRLSAKG